MLIFSVLSCVNFMVDIFIHYSRIKYISLFVYLVF